MLQFQFRICPQFLHKPQLPDLQTRDLAASDISSPPSLYIAPIAPSHTLTLNAYPVLRPSYLLLTDSPTQQQSSPLYSSDIDAAWIALDRLERGSGGEKYMMIYNCGREAGCSRSHKHMQLFPRPLDFVLFPDGPSEGILNVPFYYDIVRLRMLAPDAGASASQVYNAYLSCLHRTREYLGIEVNGYLPHNVVLVREWILFIPRRKARVGGVSANAAGMMGLVWVMSEEELAEWRRRGGRSILGELGISLNS